MAKVVYVAVAPDGTKFIRTSNHHYTHAALATAIEEAQVSAQDDERSAEMKGE